MTGEMARQHNETRVSKSTAVFILTDKGQLIGHWHEQGTTIRELDAYGGILQTLTLGVDCVKVVRNRITTVTETYEVV